MEGKIGFLEEEAGMRSATRLIFVVGSIWLMALTSYLTISKIATITEAGVFFATQFALLAGSKVIQKTQEVKK